jgi:hypothetical protein
MTYQLSHIVVRIGLKKTIKENNMEKELKTRT